MSEHPELPSKEMQDLLQLLYTCPVGLVAFSEDGTVTRINPEAVNLIVKTWSLLELGNVKTAFKRVWPELENIITSNPATPGKLVQHHRLVGGTAARPSSVSATLVRVSPESYLLTIVDDTFNVKTEKALRDSDDRLQSLFDSIDEGYCLCEMLIADGSPIDYRFLKVNPRFEKMTGLLDPVGKTALELVPELEHKWILTYARPALQRESVRFEMGSEAMGRWFDVFATPVEPHGHFALVFKDQTARHQAEQQLEKKASNNAYRARLIDVLRSRLPAVDLQIGAVGILREYLDTDRVLYVEVDENGEIDVSKAQCFRSNVSALVGRFRLDWQGPELTEDFRAGKTVVVSNIDTDLRVTEQTRLALQQTNFRSYIMVPLLRQQRVVASIVTHHAEPHQWSFDEIDIVEETAQRTMLAVEQASEDLAKRIRYERAELLAGMLESMEAMQTIDDQAQHLADTLAPRFGDYATVEASGADQLILGFAGRRFEPNLFASRAQMTVPIDLGGGVRGTLTVGIEDPTRGAFDEADLLFLQNSALRAGVVMAGTRLRQEEHKISVRLQQALLPNQVVRHNSVVIEARYGAASTYMDVGGDWYDTFSWPNGKIGLLVGDVVGHNLESAALMGRLRAGTAAMAPSTGSSPAALLDALQGFAGGPGGTKFVTASCVVIDPETGELTYSSAGHLPGLVFSPDGQIHRLEGALTAPICAIDVGQRPEGRLFLEPNALVLLYSDGLLERRGEAIDDSIARLEAAAVALISAPIDEFADRLIAAMAQHSLPEDDVVVICFRFDPLRAEFVRNLPTRLDHLHDFRTELAQWLSEHHADSDVRNDVLLAATEACTNAIEHAYLGASTGTLTVDVSSHDHQLVMKISDGGKWLVSPFTNRDRGRGIAIMKSVSKRFTRTSGPKGTTVEMVFSKSPLLANTDG